jgi:phospholipid/cholesterol/gamma-HCH transport system ATP-binding protein
METQAQEKDSQPYKGNGIVSLENVTKKFGKNIVLDNISLVIEKSKTTVVIGPSGCGKTVLIKHLIALLRPSSGRVYFKGQRIDELEEDQLDKIRMNFGFLFQGGALFDSLTVAENILFPVRQSYKTKKVSGLDELVKTKLGMVGLDGFQNYFPAQLSGGQRKRVALARAIALNPEVILYDEPTTGLDPIRADIINELILKLQKGLGLTSVAVTHDMTSAYKIADRIIMLHDGKIIADGDADFIRNHSDGVVQQFINGRVSSEELKALRSGGVTNHLKLQPRDSK